MTHSVQNANEVDLSSQGLRISHCFTRQSSLTGTMNVRCVEVRRADIEIRPFIVAIDELPFLIENLNVFFGRPNYDNWRGIDPRLKRFVDDQYPEFN